jgi:hypothetical protein
VSAVDPYVSRASLGDVVRRRLAVADPAAHERWLTPPTPVAGVLVGHTHFDHAIDVPEGIAGRSFTRDYWPRILRRLEPRLVVASHFDDFLRPLGGPLGFSLNVNLAAWPEELAAVSNEFTAPALRAPRTKGAW